MQPSAGTAPGGYRVAFLPRSSGPCHRYAARRAGRRDRVVAAALTGPPKNAWTGADLEDLPLPEGTYGWPVVGETVEFLNDMSAFAHKRISQHGNIFKSHLFGSQSVVVCSKEALKKVIQLEANGTIVNRALTPGMKIVGAKSLLALNGAEHARLKSLLCPAFSRGSVAKFVPFIVDAAKHACDELDGQGWLPISKELKKCAFTITTNSFLGMEFTSRSSEEVLHILDVLSEGIFSIGIDLPFTKFNEGMKKRAEMIDIITEAILAMEVRGTDDQKPTRALRRILDARDEEGNGIEMAAVIDTVITILYAGYDTFASVMDNILHALALNPQMREEQRQVVASHGDDITSGSLASMPYTEAVVNEGLRSRPVAQFNYRFAGESFEIDGYRIPRGWLVASGFGFVTRHMDGRWSDAGAFRPERFLEAEAHKMDTLTPFGIGHHTCLGKELALIEIRVMLAVLARWYEVRLRDPRAGVVALPVPHATDGCVATVRKLNPMGT